MGQQPRAMADTSMPVWPITRFSMSLSFACDVFDSSEVR
jgi:hypothetical protein